MPPIESWDSPETLREDLKKFIIEKCSNSIADVLSMDEDFFKNIEDYLIKEKDNLLEDVNYIQELQDYLKSKKIPKKQIKLICGYILFKSIKDDLLKEKPNLLEDVNYIQNLQIYLKSKKIPEKQIKLMCDYISDLKDKEIYNYPDTKDKEIYDSPDTKDKEIYNYPDLEHFFIWEPSINEDSYGELPEWTLYAPFEDDQRDLYDETIDTQRQKHNEPTYREFLIQQASIIQRFDKFKLDDSQTESSKTSKNSGSSKPPKTSTPKTIKISDIEPGTLHAGDGTYRDYCLFNLIWWKDDDWFYLNDFLNKIDKISQNKPFPLINFLLCMYCNNFVEFREFYNNKIDDSYIDTSKIHPLQWEKLNLYDIRCWLAHNVSFYKKNWKWWVHIKVDRRGTHKEADIEPSFFDEVLRLPATSINIDCDVVTYWKKKSFWISSHKYRYNNNQDRPINHMKDDWTFSEALSTRFSENHQYKKHEIDELCRQITSNNFEVFWNTIWLVSSINRPYVHNLFSVIIINIIYQMIKNPNIKYKDLENNLIKEMAGHTFTIQNKKEILKFCFKHVDSRLKVQALKTYYINIFNKDIQRHSDTLQEKLEYSSSQNPEMEYHKHIIKMCHIRNALAHWHYTIIWNQINMWDINKDGLIRSNWNRNADEEYCSTDINELYNDVLKKEIKFEEKEEQTKIKYIDKIVKNPPF